jgi:hypothetical protein
MRAAAVYPFREAAKHGQRLHKYLTAAVERAAQQQPFLKDPLYSAVGLTAPSGSGGATTAAGAGW